MIAKRKPGRIAKLSRLTPEQREAVFIHCREVSIEEGVRWLKETYDVDLSPNSLGRWLRALRSIAGGGRKTRPDSKIGMLKAGQQAELYSRCESLSLAEGARWLKEELGVELAQSTLGFWLRRQRLDREHARRLEDIRDNRNRAMLVGKVLGAATALTEANTILIAQAVFEEFSKSPGERDEKRLAQYMNLALKNRSIDLAYERFHTDAAKKAMEHATELREINQSGGTDAEKIAKAIKVLFGVRPENTTFQPEQAA